MLQLDLKHHAERFIKRLSPKQAGQIERKLELLALNPFPADSKQLKGSVYRGTDIGEYRIIYKVEDNFLRIPLIGKRNDDEVYRKLKRME